MEIQFKIKNQTHFWICQWWIMDDALYQLGLWPQGERTTGRIEARIWPALRWRFLFSSFLRYGHSWISHLQFEIFSSNYRRSPMPIL